MTGQHWGDSISVPLMSDARRAVTWTRNTLTPENIEFLSAVTHYLRFGEVYISHGSPREPVWEYILDPLIAALNFPHFETPYCL